MYGRKGSIFKGRRPNFSIILNKESKKHFSGYLIVRCKLKLFRKFKENKEKF